MTNTEQPPPANADPAPPPDPKEVEFYSQGLAAWFNSALEHDKSLLTLSVAGIGVLVSMMGDLIVSSITLHLYIGAIIAFLVCIIVVLIIFEKNKDHIIKVINRDSDRSKSDFSLSIISKCASIAFFTGMILSSYLGASKALSNYNDYDRKGNVMSDKKTQSKPQSYAVMKAVDKLIKLDPQPNPSPQPAPAPQEKGSGEKK